jgi:hypothetical protein
MLAPNQRTARTGNRQMLKMLTAGCLLAISWPLPHASAHYLWVVIDRQSGENGTANIYFEEGTAAGDGHYRQDRVYSCPSQSVLSVPQPSEVRDVTPMKNLKTKMILHSYRECRKMTA